jgi:hypothetical protein
MKVEQAMKDLIKSSIQQLDMLVFGIFFFSFFSKEKKEKGYSIGSMDILMNCIRRMLEHLSYRAKLSSLRNNE